MRDFFEKLESTVMSSIHLLEELDVNEITENNDDRTISLQLSNCKGSISFIYVTFGVGNNFQFSIRVSQNRFLRLNERIKVSSDFYRLKESFQDVRVNFFINDYKKLLETLNEK